MQIEEILNEVKFSRYVETGECRTDIDLPDFIRCNTENISFSLTQTILYEVDDVIIDSSSDRNERSNAAEIKKVKFSHTRYRALGPELIPVYRQSARR